MKAGFARVSILPKQPTSLAGYTDKMPRRYTHVHDEPQARAIALSSDQCGVVLISADLLTPNDRLTQAVRLHARERLPQGVDIVVHGHHTHSGPGNYWSHPVAKKFMGPFDPDIFDFLARRFAEAAVLAWQVRDDAVVRTGSEDLEGLQENRRRADGPLDPRLTALGFYSADGRPMGSIVHFAGHPVIVAERDFFAASGDYPAAVCARMEKEFPFCLFLNGAVGGLSIWFPETPIDVDAHLAKVADPIAAAASRVLASAKNADAFLAFSRQKVELPDADSQPFPPGYLWYAPVFKPVVWYWNRTVSKGFFTPRVTTLSALRVGDAAFVFHPSDLGVGAGLTTRAEGAGLDLHASPVSHCDDYAGYVHPESEMLIHPKPEKEYRGMTIYENAMGFHGRSAYVRFAAAEKLALKAVAGK